MKEFVIGERSVAPPAHWDVAALIVARVFTTDFDIKRRAALQCAVIDAMDYAAGTLPAPRNRAAEWGGYLATSVDRLLNAINEYHEAQEAVENDDEGADAKLEHANEVLGEYMQGARSSAYEFRRRVEQDAREAVPAAAAPDVLRAEANRYRAALEHIERTAQRSRSESRRDRWIAARARGALDNTSHWRAIDLPKSVDTASERVRLKHRISELEAENERLKALVPHVSPAALAVLGERHRQATVEGFDHARDDQNMGSEMAQAAACYALESAVPHYGRAPMGWPWASMWWKPSTPRRNLEKAGALILAELDRLIRAEKPCSICGGSGWYVVDGPTSESDGHHPNMEQCDDCAAERAADPCAPQCKPGGYCKTPTCGRLKAAADTAIAAGAPRSIYVHRDTGPLEVGDIGL